MTHFNMKIAGVIICTSFLIGTLNEFTAFFTHCWIYYPWWITFVNLVLMFSFIMPSIAFLLYRRSLLFIYFAGFVCGCCYEFLDQYWLHWASFPESKFLFFTDIFSIRIVIGLLWGIVPMLTVTITRWFLASPILIQALAYDEI